MGQLGGGATAFFGGLGGMIALVAADGPPWSAWWYVALVALCAICMVVGVYVMATAYVPLWMPRTLEDRGGSSRPRRRINRRRFRAFADEFADWMRAQEMRRSPDDFAWAATRRHSPEYVTWARALRSAYHGDLRAAAIRYFEWGMQKGYFDWDARPANGLPLGDDARQAVAEPQTPHDLRKLCEGFARAAKTSAR